MKATLLGLVLLMVAAASAAVPAVADAAAPTSGGTAEAVAFYALAGAAALAALGCVIATNIVRMAVCLLGALAAVALLYFLLMAGFLGVVQLVVYAGGTLIVIVFGVMLTSRTYGAKLHAGPLELAGGILVGLALLTGLIAALLPSFSVPPTGAGQPASFTVAEIGTALLAPYLLPFELASVLLLAVMLGAAFLASPVRSEEGA